MIRNEKGVVALAVILSMLMVVGAIAVFGFVSGRLGTTYKLARRPQAILDAESASYVSYMLMRENIWDTPAERTDAGSDLSRRVSLIRPDGAQKRVDITITSDGSNQIQASPIR